MTEKEKAIRLIERSNKILCITSQQYSGDGISSLLALQEWLIINGKTPVVVVPNNIEKKYKFLKPSGKITQELEQKGDFVIAINTNQTLVDKIKYKVENGQTNIMIRPKSGMFSPDDISFGTDMGDFDLIITLDCFSLQSVGSIFQENTEAFSSLPILNISTHITGDLFGRVNYIDTQGSSSSEALYQIIKETNQEKIPSSLATKLLAGIISATGSFLENSTTAQALRISGELQKSGANQSKIIDYLFKRKTLSILKVWGSSLKKLNLDPVHRICWTSLDQNDLSAYSVNDIENLSDEVLRFVKESDFSILMYQNSEAVNIQIRTANQTLNLAEHFQQYSPSEVPYGIDIVIEDQDLLQIQEKFLKKATQLQKKRLGLPEQTEIHSVNIGKKYSHDIETNKQTEEAPKQEPRKTPEKIPFEAPQQKPEKERIREVVEKPSNPLTYFASDSKIPTWLKKNRED